MFNMYLGQGSSPLSMPSAILNDTYIARYQVSMRVMRNPSDGVVSQGHDA